MGDGLPAAMCVVTVEDGPDGQRWALVAVNPDPARDPSAVSRSKHRSSAEVLAVVARFLADAGLREPPAGP